MFRKVASKKMNEVSVDSLIETLNVFADIRIDLLKNGQRMVSVYPRNHGNLWWYGADEKLATALLVCLSKAKEMGFVK